MALTLDQQRALALAAARMRAAEADGAPQPDSPGLGGTAIDMLRSVPGGLAQGVAATAGLPGDARELLTRGIKAIGGDTAASVFNTGMRAIPMLNTPASGDINNAFSTPTGGYYDPRTTAGKVTETAASFAPAAFGGEGSALSRILGRVVAPAVGSVTGGDIAKDVGAPEQVGQIAGAFGGALAGRTNPLTALANLKAAGAPTIGALKAAARSAYDTVDKSGMIIGQPAFDRLMGTIKNDLAGLGFHPKLQPKTAAALDAMDTTATGLSPPNPSPGAAALPGSGGTLPVQGTTLKGLDVLRRIAQHATDPLNKSDTMMSRHIVDHIDDFVKNMSPNDVIGPVDKSALDALGSARELWARSAKGQQIQDLMDKAHLNAKSMKGNFSILGYGDALRTQFRQLANNARGMARFSPAEQTAIRNVATGGPVENVLRLVGKLSPDQTIPMLSEAAAAVYDPKTLAVPIAGLAGKAGASALTQRSARLASELMRNGRAANVATTPTLAVRAAQITPASIARVLSQPYIASTKPTSGAATSAEIARKLMMQQPNVPLSGLLMQGGR